jgi:hypothetical protein
VHAKPKPTASPPAQCNMRVPAVRVPAIPLSPPRYVASPILSCCACQTETNSVSSCTVQYACPSRSVIPPWYVASPILSYYACQTETNSVSSCTVHNHFTITFYLTIPFFVLSFANDQVAGHPCSFALGILFFVSIRFIYLFTCNICNPRQSMYSYIICFSW